MQKLILVFCLVFLDMMKFSSYCLAENQQDKRLIILGDSLTAGFGVDIDEAFPALIEQKAKAEKINLRVVNSGISGDTSAGGLSRVDWLLKSPPDYFLLALGANDGLRGLSVEQMAINLRKTIQKVKAANLKTVIFIAGMLVPPNQGRDYSDKYSAAFKQVAGEENVDLIPFLLEGVAGHSDLNLPDGIHPNVQGHRVIAEHIWRSIKSKILDAER